MHTRAALAALLLLAATAAGAQSRSAPNRFAELDRACEDARLVKLTPLRQQKTDECVKTTRKTRAQCEADFADWGNTRGLAGGGARAGLFYDLPECKAAAEARRRATGR
ncbi:MAG: hypothetical protein ACK5RK_06850 [Betaproteobacteria bacterium]